MLETAETSEVQQEEGKRYFRVSKDDLLAASSSERVELECFHSNLDRPNWMSRLGPRFLESKVGEVFWPGTHDSGAYCKDFDYGKVVHHDPLRMVGTHLLNCLGQTINRVASEWSRTQTMSVKEQLEHGVRYLDLRISRCAKDNCYYIVHSFCGPPLDEVLSQINNFLKQHKKECLLVEVDPISWVNHVELHEIFRTRLDGFLLRREQSSCSTSPMSLTLSDLIENGRVVVLYSQSSFREHKEYIPYFWNNRFIDAPFVMSLDPSVKEGHQLEQFQCFSSEYHNNADLKHQKLFHFMYALTPNLSEILRGVVKPIRTNPGNLQECAQRINPRLADFLDRIKEHVRSDKCSDLGMIFSVDFIGESKLMDQFISLNELRFIT